MPSTLACILCLVVIRLSESQYFFLILEILQFNCLAFGVEIVGRDPPYKEAAETSRTKTLWSPNPYQWG